VTSHGPVMREDVLEPNTCYLQAPLVSTWSDLIRSLTGLGRCPRIIPFSPARLGIPIFGSNFWDPHWKRKSGSVSDSKDSGRKNFNQIPLLKNQEIGIPIPKFGIPKKINIGI
jgi:hypothetical protein